MKLPIINSVSDIFSKLYDDDKMKPIMRMFACLLMVAILLFAYCYIWKEIKGFRKTLTIPKKDTVYLMPTFQNSKRN
jgi:hypothetical protein